MAKKKAVTYGELTSAIRNLKYARDPKLSTDTYTVFHRRGRHLPIMLPVLDENEAMREIYVVMVRHTVDQNDEGDAEKFDALTNGYSKRRSASILAL